MNQQQMAPVPRGSSTMKWLLIILVVIIILGGGYLLYQRYGKTSAPTSSPSAVAVVSPSSSPSSTAPADEKAVSTYSNSELGFALTIPSGYQIQVEQMYEGARGVKIRFGKKTNDLVSEYNFAELIVHTDAPKTLEQLKTSFLAGHTDILKTSDIKIAGIDAVKYEIGGMGSGFSETVTSGKLLVEMTQYPAQNSDFLDQTLSTFQFTK